MNIRPEIAARQGELTAFRRDIHRHPETAFEEVRTAAMVAEKLESWGLDVYRGLGKTGVVGTLRAGDSNRAIGLRADMDALPVDELNAFDHRSVIDGKMHACGHDGHTTMLLGAARYLAETRRFDGTVYFIFQPAEENEGGGRVMVEEGLFERFPMDQVYGMHNWPGEPAGRFAVRPGPMMAAFDTFEITLTGRGAHAAMPHLGVDPVVCAAQVVQALQTITARNTDPQDAAVVSVTQIHGGDTWNVIPEEVVLRGTCRSFKPEVQDTIEARLRQIVESTAAAYGVASTVHYERRYPSVINTVAETEFAAQVAAEVAGAENVEREPVPSMGSEDFAFMLNKRPGCYIWLGNGPTDGGCLLHNPRYAGAYVLGRIRSGAQLQRLAPAAAPILPGVGWCRRHRGYASCWRADGAGFPRTRPRKYTLCGHRAAARPIRPGPVGG